MQNISGLKQYVEQQYQCRDMDSPLNLNKNIKKDELQNVTRKVEECVGRFYKLNAAERRDNIKEMRSIVSNFGKILKLEKGEEAEKIHLRLERKMLGILPNLQFNIEEPVEQPHLKNVEKNVSDRDEAEAFFTSNIKRCFSVHGRGGYFEAKHFVQGVLERFFDETEKYPEKRIDLEKIFLDEAERLYSPIRIRAGDAFTEEEMMELIQEYYGEKEEVHDAYLEYDQDLLTTCIQAFLEPECFEESWEDIELVRFRIGKSEEELNKMKHFLTAMLKDFRSVSSQNTPVNTSNSQVIFEQTLLSQKYVEECIQLQVERFLSTHDLLTDYLNADQFAAAVVKNLSAWKGQDPSRNITVEKVRGMFRQFIHKMQKREGTEGSPLLEEWYQFEEILLKMAASFPLDIYLKQWNTKLTEAMRVGWEPGKV